MRITNDVSNTSGSQSGKQPLKPASYEINTLARYVILLDKITENNRVPSFEPITLEELEKKGFGTLKEEIQKIQGELRECIHASIPFHKRLLDHISASLPVAGPSGFGYIQRFNPPTFGTSSTPSSPKINRDTGNISTGFISVIRKSITDLEADPSFVDDIFCRENLTTLILENVSKKEQGNVLLLVKDVLRVYHEIITKRPEVSNLRSIFRIDWHEVRDDSKDSLCLSADTISALSNLQPKKLQDGLVRMNKFYGFLVGCSTSPQLAPSAGSKSPQNFLANCSLQWHFRNSFQNVRDCFESLLKKESWSRRSGQPPASNPAEQLELSIYDYYHTSESTNGQCLGTSLRLIPFLCK